MLLPALVSHEVSYGRYYTNESVFSPRVCCPHHFRFEYRSDKFYEVISTRRVEATEVDVYQSTLGIGRDALTRTLSRVWTCPDASRSCVFRGSGSQRLRPVFR